MDRYDVAVVGGGAAGLSAAMVLARSRRSVVVVDAGSPRNAPAAAVHGLLARDGTPPAELLERGREEVRRYGGEVTGGEVVKAVREGDAFAVTLADGRSLSARRLLVTTGLVDELPDVPGLRERWGDDVLHCPYCHGWEVRDRAIGILSGGPNSVHQALLFRQLSDDVTFFAHLSPPDAEASEQLAARGIPVVPGVVTSLVTADGRLTGVRLDDGTVVGRDVLVVASRMVARSGLLAALGLEPVPHPSGLGEYVPCDVGGRTAVPGVWVAGNVTDLAAQVGAAAAAGATAAAQINGDLVAEETRLAVEDRRVGGGDGASEPAFDSAYWESRYRTHGGAGSGAGEPNPSLVDAASGLAPGRVLDAGCGRGADAIWLAARGWHVTAVDVSGTALAAARERAASYGDDVARRIDWVEADVADWSPPAGGYDLVTSHYVHVPAGAQEAFVRRLAAAVAAGGSLLVVGHDVSGLGEGAHGSAPEAYADPAAVAGLLDPAAWDVELAETRTRTVAAPHGDGRTLRDAAVRARRRP